MAQTTNKFQIIQKVSETDTMVLHPETDASIVKYDGTTAGLSATDAKTAIDELASQIDDITGGGVVTGIKGNTESAYRKGQVNLTAANIGAETAGAVATHNSNTSAHTDIRNLITAAQNKANQAYTLAEGRARAVAFDTLDSVKTNLKAASNSAYKVGDHILIKATNTPDYWISAILTSNTGDYGYYELTALETPKVDLSGYQTKTDSSLTTTAKTVVGAIGEVKTTADSALSKATTNATNITNIINGTTVVSKATSATSATSATTATSAGKWTTARTIGVTVGSGTKSDGSTAITATGSQSVDGSANKTISVTLGDSGVAAGVYSAIQVNSKGIATAGGQIIEIGSASQTSPSADLATGGIFFKMIS